MTSGVIRRRVIVSGRVQGVWFRDSCRRVAAEHSVTGFARNLADGTVEAVFEGSPGDVDRLVAWCRTGPPRARVDRVEVTDEAPEGATGFSVA